VRLHIFAVTRCCVPSVMFLISAEMLSFKSCNVRGLFANTLSFSKPHRKKSGLVRWGDFGGQLCVRNQACHPVCAHEKHSLFNSVLHDSPAHCRHVSGLSLTIQHKCCHLPDYPHTIRLSTTHGLLCSNCERLYASPAELLANSSGRFYMNHLVYEGGPMLTVQVSATWHLNVTRLVQWVEKWPSSCRCPASMCPIFTTNKMVSFKVIPSLESA
jgi:hypothetical protein